MNIENLTLDDLNVNNGWKCIADFKDKQFRVYENWKEKSQLLYAFYEGPRKGEITFEPYKTKMMTVDLSKESWKTGKEPVIVKISKSKGIDLTDNSKKFKELEESIKIVNSHKDLFKHL